MLISFLFALFQAAYAAQAIGYLTGKYVFMLLLLLHAGYLCFNHVKKNCFFFRKQFNQYIYYTFIDLQCYLQITIKGTRPPTTNFRNGYQVIKKSKLACCIIT